MPNGYHKSKNRVSIAALTLPACLGIAVLLLSSCSGTGKTSAKQPNCKLAAQSGASISVGGFPRNPNRLNSTGTVRATIIMVDFPDAAATLTPAQAYAKISGAEATFSQMSYGRLQYTMSPVYQWFRMSQNSTQYSLGSGGTIAYIQEAVSLADPTVNFSTTESLVILSNPDAAGIGNVGPASTGAPGSGITADGKEMFNLVSSAYDLNTWGSIWLNHEVSHTMGLVDLYAYTQQNPSSSYDNLRYMGEFSYMAFNSFTANAPELTAWERWVLGWVDDDQMQCTNPLSDGAVVTLIAPIEIAGGKKAVVVPLSGTKVLVVESRRRLGLDRNMAKEGALVYIVNSSLASGRGAIQVYPIDLTNDPRFFRAPLAAGESITLEGIKIQVLSASPEGDVVQINDLNEGRWFDW